MKSIKTKNHLLALLMLCGATSWSQCSGFAVDFDFDIVGGDINFTNTSVGEGSTSTYDWTYSSQTSSLENPTMTAEVGTYLACLTVITIMDSSGIACTGSYCDSIYWDGDTTTTTDPCEDLEASFDWEIDGTDVDVTNTSTGEGSSSTYNWTYGAQTSSLENPTFTGIEGLEVICLTLVTYFDSGSVCTDYICDSVYFWEDTTSTDPCDDLEADFSFTYTLIDVIVTNTSTGEGDWSDYNWTYGTQSSTDENPIFDPEWGPQLICLTLVSYFDSGSVVCTSVLCDTIYYDSSAVGLPTEGEIASLLIYPNPVEGELNVQLTNDNFDQLEIYNAIGQLIYSDRLQPGLKQTIISTEELEQGMYILRVFDSASPEKMMSKRFVRK